MCPPKKAQETHGHLSFFWPITYSLTVFWVKELERWVWPFIHGEGTLVGDDWSHKSTDSVSTFSHPLHSLPILGGGHYPRVSSTRCGQLQCFCQFLRFCSGKKGEISVGRTVPAGRRASCGKGRDERATGGEYIVYVKWINKWCQAVYFNLYVCNTI